MRSLPSAPLPTNQPQPTSTLNFPPRLWPHLSPLHQQQLAYRLADLIRRIHRLAPTTEEVRHD
jgi:hypothetical protein